MTLRTQEEDIQQSNFNNREVLVAGDTGLTGGCFLEESISGFF